MLIITAWLPVSIWWVYPNIPYDLVLEALSYWIDKKCKLLPKHFANGFILEAASFLLTNNNFQIDDKLSYS